MESIINDSSLDDIMDAGIRAEISSNGKSIDLNTFRPWKKWVNRFRSSKELDRGWTASKILTTISLFVPPYGVPARRHINMDHIGLLIGGDHSPGDLHRVQ